MTTEEQARALEERLARIEALLEALVPVMLVDPAAPASHRAALARAYDALERGLGK